MTTPTTEELPRLGRYQVLNKLAQGGMAEIFLAKALGVMGFERLVAIKLIHSQLTRDSDFVKMFIDEARIAMHLQHRNIVQVFDLDKAGDTYFIAMEYVHGVNLYDVYERIAAKGRWFDLPLALYIVAEVCKGLHFAHTRLGPDGRPLGIVHRDISPQNVLLSFEGEVKITDFGIAKAAERLHVTTPGIVKGKYAYMAPEILKEKHVDGRADVFAAGVLLYELLVGENPFAGATPVQTIENVLHKKVPAPSQRGAYVSTELDQIALTALAKDPAERYASGAELAEALTDHGLDLTAARRDMASGDATVSALLHELFPERAKRAPLAGAPGSFSLPMAESSQPIDTSPQEKISSAAADPSNALPTDPQQREEIDSTLLNLGDGRPSIQGRGRYDEDELSTALELDSIGGPADGPQDRTEPVKMDFEPVTDRSLPSISDVDPPSQPVILSGDDDFDGVDETVLNQDPDRHWSTPEPASPAVSLRSPDEPTHPPQPVQPVRPLKSNPQHVPQVVPHTPQVPQPVQHVMHPPFAVPAAPIGGASVSGESYTPSRSEPLVVPVGPQLDGVLNRPFAPAPVPRAAGSRGLLFAGLGLVVLAAVVLAVLLLMRGGGSGGQIAVRVSSTPPGAQVLIDGSAESEPTPMETSLAVGQTHRVEIQLPGYRSYKKDILALEGVEPVVDATLEPITGSISFEVVPPDAIVTLNGVKRGAVQPRIEGLQVGQDVVVRLEREGYLPAQETVSLTEQAPDAVVRLTLEKAPEEKRRPR